MQAEKEGVSLATNLTVRGTDLENKTVEEYNNDKNLRNPFLLAKK